MQRPDLKLPSLRVAQASEKIFAITGATAVSPLLPDCMVYSENDTVVTDEDVQVCIICYVLPVALHLMLLYQETRGEEGELTGGRPSMSKLFDIAGIVSIVILMLTS